MGEGGGWWGLGRVVDGDGGGGGGGGEWGRGVEGVDSMWRLVEGWCG